MKIDAQTYASKDWRALTLAEDFDLLDTWQFPIRATGAQGQRFEDFCTLFASLANDRAQLPWMARWLFGLRERMGRWFGWDKSANTLSMPGETSTTLRDRLSDDERASQASFYEATDLQEDPMQFRLVYRLADEQLSEISNATVHAMMHLVWADDDGVYVPRMGVYVKRRGWFGQAYMTLIAPFRHWIVYPAMMRQVRASWAARTEGA